MADIKTPEARSRNMAAIKGKNTKPEIFLRKQLYALGYRYRVNAPSIQGHPDIWLKKYNTAIFVHGCFWHRHPGCKYAYVPKSRVEFWNRKFEDNTRRDKKIQDELNSNGVRCLIVWECTIRKMLKSDEIRKAEIQRIVDFLKSSASYREI